MAPKTPQDGVQESPTSLQHVLKKGVVVIDVVVVVIVVDVVVVIAVVFLVVVPFVLPCSSREHRPTTLDDQCTSQRWLF